MTSSRIATFCKNGDCPASDELLEFQNGVLARKRAGDVRSHLASCEFCSAEVDLYSHYPQADGGEERIEICGIPAPLFQLAEALLKKKQADPSSLDSLLRENGLVFDKA